MLSGVPPAEVKERADHQGEGEKREDALAAAGGDVVGARHGIPQLPGQWRRLGQDRGHVHASEDVIDHGRERPNDPGGRPPAEQEAEERVAETREEAAAATRAHPAIHRARLAIEQQRPNVLELDDRAALRPDLVCEVGQVGDLGALRPGNRDCRHGGKREASRSESRGRVRGSAGSGDLVCMFVGDLEHFGEARKPRQRLLRSPDVVDPVTFHLVTIRAKEGQDGNEFEPSLTCPVGADALRPRDRMFGRQLEGSRTATIRDAEHLAGSQKIRQRIGDVE